MRGRERMFVCLLILAAALTASAYAQSASNWTWCKNAGQKFSPEQQIAGCTAIIQSGKESGANLADAYRNRSDAFADKGDFKRAAEDAKNAFRITTETVCQTEPGRCR